MKVFEVNDKDIDKTHFTSEKKILSALRNTQKKIITSDKKIHYKLLDRPRKNYPHKKENYYVPIFSKYPYGYQIDLLEQSKNNNDYPKFFFIAININTRYAYAYPQSSKNEKECIASMQKFYKDADEKVVSIICDQEKGFQSQGFLKFCTDNEISIKLVDDERHSVLAIIDRFIRTLRDMNTPGVESKEQSNHDKYRDFSIKRMNHLLEIYNKTYHSGIDMTPQEMSLDKEKERKYILNKLYHSEKRKKIKDYNLEDGEFVRFITVKDKNKKHRYKVSPEAFQISNKQGNAYVIMAEDGTVKTIQRWRLFPLGVKNKRDLKKIKFGKTLGGNKGVLEKITKKVGDAKYAVDFKMPDGKVFKDVIHKNNLRGNNPQRMSAEEKEYLKMCAMKDAPY